MNPSTIQAIGEFLCIDQEPLASDLIFIPGSKQLSLAEKAAELYRRGIAPRVMVSGCGHYDANAGETEADVLAAKLLDLGVPETAILLEKESRNTLDNIVLSSAIIDEQIGWKSISRITLVCKNFHSRRLVMTAERHWPRHVELRCVSIDAELRNIRMEDWWKEEESRVRVLEEIERIGKYAARGDIGNFE